MLFLEKKQVNAYNGKGLVKTLVITRGGVVRRVGKGDDV